MAVPGKRNDPQLSHFFKIEIESIDSATQSAGPGPSLEQLLWRVMDRLPEEPALVDSDEFAAHIAGSLIAGTPAEAWVDRFFAGNPQLRDQGGLDLAQAIVHASRRR